MFDIDNEATGQTCLSRHITNMSCNNNSVNVEYFLMKFTSTMESMFKIILTSFYLIALEFSCFIM